MTDSPPGGTDETVGWGFDVLTDGRATTGGAISGSGVSTFAVAGKPTFECEALC